jgi:5-methylthioribose kinase
MDALGDAGGYRVMDVEALRGWLAAAPALAERLGGAPGAWTIHEIGDGNLNLVFIAAGPAGSVITKQALPYLRVVGEGWPLPLSRSHYEHLALQHYARVAPGLAPEVHHYDADLALIVMEHLTPHQVVRKGLVQGLAYPRLAADVADFLAATLFHGSALGASAAQHKATMAAFAGNHELCRITEELVFTDPYREAPLNRWTRPHLDGLVAALRTDAPLKAAAQARKHQFITSAQALIHGDLHTGSIMATAESTKVIDPEFAFVGPMGFDVGAILANLLLAYFAQSCRGRKDEADLRRREELLGYLRTVWNGFEERFLALWRAGGNGDAYPASLFAHDEAAALEAARAAFMKELFHDSLAFAGCKMIRRIVGLAHVEDFESIEDPARRAVGEAHAIRLGRELIMTPHRFRSIEAVAEAAQELAG